MSRDRWRDLDDEVPHGDPEAVFCRWCHTGRVRSQTGKGLICVGCDTNTVVPQVPDTGPGSL